ARLRFRLVSRFGSSQALAANSERTSNFMILVPLLNPKFATVPAERSCELRVRGARRFSSFNFCCGPSLLGSRPDVRPDLADLLVADHPLPRGHLALAVAHDLVEVRLLVGAQQLEVRTRAGRVQALAVTCSAMFRVHVPSGIGRG